MGLLDPPPRQQPGGLLGQAAFAQGVAPTPAEIYDFQQINPSAALLLAKYPQLRNSLSINAPSPDGLPTAPGVIDQTTNPSTLDYRHFMGRNGNYGAVPQLFEEIFGTGLRQADPAGDQHLPYATREAMRREAERREAVRAYQARVPTD